MWIQTGNHALDGVFQQFFVIRGFHIIGLDLAIGFCPSAYALHGQATLVFFIGKALDTQAQGDTG